MKLSRNTRCFLASFAATGCLILLVCGMVTVDYHTARVGFGRKEPMILVEVAQEKTSLRINAMGLEREWDITQADQWFRRVENAAITALEKGNELLEQIPLQNTYK